MTMEKKQDPVCPTRKHCLGFYAFFDHCTTFRNCKCFANFLKRNNSGSKVMARDKLRR
ncbi:hypothetical protein ALC56_06164 [Trachymyrmex septentrionalis]|uniref:Uncharacterized protein n=1 Tax=Trachymyrmex septentrionalis TaxID=34720 RepID=A0A195FI63_9HYME|nr:hypothetical protein ALC56_06164 [Trachymyrmex septentrionalis]